MNTRLRKYVGDRDFYRMVMAVAIPMILQNTITNVVNLIDNVMVGQLGTEMMSGVSIANQLLFIYNLCLFGAASGAGIFGAQFFGKGDHDGLRYTFRFKLYVGVLLTVLFDVIALTAGPQLVSLFLTEDGTADLKLTLDSAMTYLHIMLLGLIPFLMSTTYSGTLRDQGQTVIPMISGGVATIVNMCLNWVLIFGHLGAPRLGVAGAAIATVISRFVELLILAFFTHTHAEKFPFVRGVYRSLYIPGKLAKEIGIKGLPMLLNESLWSITRSAIVQSYSTRGLMVIAALNISGTVEHMFSVCVFSFGSAIAILVGQRLGAGENEEAVDTNRKLTAFSAFCAFCVGIVMLLVAPLFPELYNTSDEAKSLAVSLIRVSAVFLPMVSCYNATYFTLRSGGKTFITFLFDSVSLTVINLPLAWCLCKFTGLPILPIYILVQLADLPKLLLGMVLVIKQIWVKQVV